MEIYGEYTLTAGGRTWSVRNKVNRRLRTKMLSLLLGYAPGGWAEPSSWTAHHMRLGKGSGAPEETDEALFNDYGVTLSLALFPAQTDFTAETALMSAHASLYAGEHASEIPAGSQITEIGVFTADGKMLSHVLLDPLVERDAYTDVSVTWTLSVRLNELPPPEYVGKGFTTC